MKKIKAQSRVNAVQAAVPTSNPSAALPRQAPEVRLQGDATQQARWTSLLLGLMILMAPALGVPNEEMLQDTLKSIIVSIMALGTLVFFFWLQRPSKKPLVWHGLMWLPIVLIAYALGSMAWSHTYLAGVEAIRWLIFSVILWLGMNSLTHGFENRVLWGIHWGAFIASVWTALQFWFDFSVFPQGPNPASTFVNRNFFGEYAICALPYSIYLVTQMKSHRSAFALAASVGFNLVALMMSGTRSALFALLVFLLLVPLICLRCRPQLGVATWSRKKIVTVLTIFLGTVLTLGSISTGNPKLVTEFGPLSAIGRAAGRTVSMAMPDEYTTGSFSVRSVMWAATGRMIAANPVAGVGAGAWEVQSPLYQIAGSQLETDFYAHNEILQLMAEYGLVGWLFLGLLFAYLSHCAYRTWHDRSDAARQQAPLRATALCSVLMLLIVSNAGFPWRMAATGALFALSLSLLAASDARLGQMGRFWVQMCTLSAAQVRWALALGSISLLMAFYIAQRAADSERTLVRGIKLALTISKSGNPRHPYWDAPKVEMLSLMRQGIELNRHYRKLTPMTADELASWGDWKNAVWIWESVLESRPNVVAIVTNIARGHLETGNLQQAQLFLDRAQHLQPTARAVRALNAIFLSRTGQEALAAKELRALFKDGIADYDLVYSAYVVGTRIKDWPLAIQALELRIERWPAEAVDGWLKLGAIYEKKSEIHNDDKALSAYRAALANAPEALKESTRNKIPGPYRDRL